MPDGLRHQALQVLGIRIASGINEMLAVAQAGRVKSVTWSHGKFGEVLAALGRLKRRK